MCLLFKLTKPTLAQEEGLCPSPSAVPLRLPCEIHALRSNGLILLSGDIPTKVSGVRSSETSETSSWSVRGLVDVFPGDMADYGVKHAHAPNKV